MWNSLLEAGGTDKEPEATVDLWDNIQNLIKEGEYSTLIIDTLIIIGIISLMLAPIIIIGIIYRREQKNKSQNNESDE